MLIVCAQFCAYHLVINQLLRVKPEMVKISLPLNIHIIIYKQWVEFQVPNMHAFVVINFVMEYLTNLYFSNYVKLFEIQTKFNKSMLFIKCELFYWYPYLITYMSFNDTILFCLKDNFVNFQIFYQNILIKRLQPMASSIKQYVRGRVSRRVRYREDIITAIHITFLLYDKENFFFFEKKNTNLIGYKSARWLMLHWPSLRPG